MIAVTLDELVALPDPDDCVKPGTKMGKFESGDAWSTCGCERHVRIRRAEQRRRDARRGRGSRPTQLGGSWLIGVNALDAAPLVERLAQEGLAVPYAMRDLPADHPFPELAPLVRRTISRGWLTLHEADLLCVRMLSSHPWHVFGAAWDRLETGEPL